MLNSNSHKPRMKVIQSLQRGRYSASQGMRATWYGLHYLWLKRSSNGVNREGEPQFKPASPPPKAGAVRAAMLDLFKQDRTNVELGLYPAPDDVSIRNVFSALRSSRLFLKDARIVDARRERRDGREVKDRISETEKYPAYYRQNFHYQTDGWFSEDSARLYDTQVEVLFSGAADAMRRMVLAEISKEIRNLKRPNANYVDIACGTGRFLKQVKQALPRVKASGLDLSPAYCEHAREQVSRWPNVDIVQGQAEATSFDDESFDIVSSIYLFHELPPKVRREAAREAFRILRPGGLIVFGDAIQPGDNPNLDRMLEYFPEGFHEPYFKSYGRENLDKLFEDVGFEIEASNLAFLTKIKCLRKPA